MTIIKYMTRFNEIHVVEVERETEQSVWIQRTPKSEPRRSNKVGGYEAYYDSWTLARDALMGAAQHEVDIARAALQRANDRLGNVKGMKPPKESA